MSCLGAWRLQRQWWGSRCGCAAVGYGVDEVLGVDGHYTRALQQHLSRLAADVSFAKAQEHLTALLPVNLSKEALRRECHRPAYWSQAACHPRIGGHTHAPKSIGFLVDAKGGIYN